MESLAPGILGGLIGSVLTVLIARMFDLWQKRQEHRYGLQAKFFVRKLHVAEHAVAAHYTMGGALQGMATAIQGLASDEEDHAWDEVWSHFGPAFQQQMARVQEADWVSVNAFPLYFDSPTDDDLWQSERLRDYMKGFARLSGLVAAGRHWRDLINTTEVAALKEEFEGRLDQVKAELKVAIDDLADTMEDMNKVMAGFVHRSRSEMTRFEA